MRYVVKLLLILTLVLVPFGSLHALIWSQALPEGLCIRAVFISLLAQADIRAHRPCCLCPLCTRIHLDVPPRQRNVLFRSSSLATRCSSRCVHCSVLSPHSCLPDSGLSWNAAFSSCCTRQSYRYPESRYHSRSSLHAAFSLATHPP